MHFGWADRAQQGTHGQGKQGDEGLHGTIDAQNRPIDDDAGFKKGVDCLPQTECRGKHFFFVAGIKVATASCDEERSRKPK